VEQRRVGLFRSTGCPLGAATKAASWRRIVSVLATDGALLSVCSFLFSFACPLTSASLRPPLNRRLRSRQIEWRLYLAGAAAASLRALALAAEFRSQVFPIPLTCSHGRRERSLGPANPSSSRDKPTPQIASARAKPPPSSPDTYSTFAFLKKRELRAAKSLQANEQRLMGGQVMARLRTSAYVFSLKLPDAGRLFFARPNLNQIGPLVSR